MEDSRFFFQNPCVGGTKNRRHSFQLPWTGWIQNKILAVSFFNWYLASRGTNSKSKRINRWKINVYSSMKIQILIKISRNLRKWRWRYFLHLQETRFCKIDNDHHHMSINNSDFGILSSSIAKHNSPHVSSHADYCNIFQVYVDIASQQTVLKWAWLSIPECKVNKCLVHGGTKISCNTNIASLKSRNKFHFRWEPRKLLRPKLI